MGTVSEKYALSDKLTDTAHEKERYRHLTGRAHIWTRFILIFMAFTGLLFAMRFQAVVRYALWDEQYMGLCLGIALGALFFLVPATKTSPRNRIPWYDYILHWVAIAIGIYTFYRIPGLQLGFFSTVDSIVGGVALVVSVEAVRRCTGYVLVTLFFLFVLYGLLGHVIPGTFMALTFPFKETVAYLYFDQGATLGITLFVVVSIVIAFFLLAEVLVVLGGQDFLINFAAGTMGRYRGGPAKVAVIASSLFGTISGSAVANVVFVGSMTIPTMKKTGYPSYVAGAIEAAASTGGQIMPPMMGVAAFIMANYLGVSYASICIAAAIPALLYYLPLFLQTDLEAAKSNIKGLPPSDYPPLRKTIKGAYLFFVPLILLSYFLFYKGYEADIGGAYTVLGTLALGLLVKWRGWQMIRSLPRIFENAGRAMVEIIVISIIAGVVMGVLSQSGLGLTFSQVVARIGITYGTLIMLIMVAAVAILLGMGMPTPVVYIFMASLLGPGLVAAGLQALPAHLFIFYFACISMVTPPVALAAYAASAIAEAPYFKTGWRATRMSIAAFIVPFIFVYQPAMIMMGAPLDILAVVLSGVLLCALLSAIVTQYSLFAPITWYENVLLVADAGFLVWAIIYGSHAIWWPTILVSAFIIVAIFSKGKLYRKPKTVTVGASTTNPPEQSRK